MTEVEEKQLWARFKERGDRDARDALIVHHMRIVRYIAGRMAIHVPTTVEMDDLVGWGIMGLMDALEKFDYQQDIKFSTYASIRIRGAILDEIRSLDWAPRSLRTMARKIGASREKLRHARGGEPSSDAIAEELGISAEQVQDTLSQLQTAQVLSLDSFLPGEDVSETRRVEVTGNRGAPSPIDVATNRERQELLVQAILALPDPQQKVLNLYYYDELTLKEVGAVLDVSESRVCQIHGTALKSLRKALKEPA